jgi:hypothetical protein
MSRTFVRVAAALIMFVLFTHLGVGLARGVPGEGLRVGPVSVHVSTAHAYGGSERR